jgi:hypothetical protein
MRFRRRVQVAEFPDRARRYETRPDHSVTQKIGQTGTVFPVGLVATPSFHLLSVCQHYDKGVLKDVENRLPVWASAFHGHVRTFLFPEPLAELFQLCIKCAEHPFLG